MGCGLTKEKLQTDILVLQLEKVEIQEEKERLIHQLELLTKKKETFYLFILQIILQILESYLQDVAQKIQNKSNLLMNIIFIYNS